jgi:DNA-binding helix-hairpin-helix protein with protein kinase domain
LGIDQEHGVEIRDSKALQTQGLGGHLQSARDAIRMVLGAAMKLSLNEQCDKTWRSMRLAKPESKRRTNLERDLVHIQIKRLKQELKGKAK